MMDPFQQKYGNVMSSALILPALVADVLWVARTLVSLGKLLHTVKLSGTVICAHTYLWNHAGTHRSGYTMCTNTRVEKQSGPDVFFGTNSSIMSELRITARWQVKRNKRNMWQHDKTTTTNYRKSHFAQPFMAEQLYWITFSCQVFLLFWPHMMFSCCSSVDKRLHNKRHIWKKKKNHHIQDTISVNMIDCLLSPSFIVWLIRHGWPVQLWVSMRRSSGRV